MKKFALFFACSACFHVAAFAQSLTFNRTYETTRYSDARGIVATQDGCFAFTGLSKSAADVSGDMYLTKVNAAGAVLWTKYYGRDQEDGGNHLLVTSDGGFLLTGHTALSYGKDCDGYLVKTDADGNEQWRFFIGTALDDVCSSSIELSDGSFLITGRIEDAETGTFRVMLANVTADGQQIYLKALPTTLPSIGFKIAAAADGNVLISGYSYHTDQQNTEMLVLKCTPGGAVLWQTNWGTDLNDRGYAILPLSDGSCIAVGGSSDASDRSVNMLALRLDADGAIIAYNTALAPVNGYLYDILLTSDDRIAIAGDLSSAADAKAVPAVAYLDTDLNISEWHTADYPVSCRTRCMVQDLLGNFVVSGNIQSVDHAGVFLSKIGAEAVSSAAQDAYLEPFLLFPNPFSEFTYLKIGEPFQTKVLTITGLDGKIVRSTTFDQAEIFIYRESLPSGTYVFAVQNNKGALMSSGTLSIR